MFYPPITQDPSQMTEEELQRLQATQGMDGYLDPQSSQDMQDAADGLGGYMAPVEVTGMDQPQAPQAAAPDQPQAANEIQGLQNYIKQFEAQKTGIDWTPLAAYIDTINKNPGYLTQAAKATRGMTADEKALKLADLQAKLAGATSAQELKKAQMEFNKGQKEIDRADKNQFRDVRTGIMEDRAAAQAADKFDNDSVLKRITNMRQQVELDRHTLDTAEVLTPQIFNEIQIGLANAISGGRTAAVSTQNKVEFESLQTQLIRLKQKVSNRPEDIASPEVRKMLSDTMGRLAEAYDNNAHERAKSIAHGRMNAYKHIPAAREVIQYKVDSYKPAPKGPAIEPPPETKEWSGKKYQKKGDTWEEVH